MKEQKEKITDDVKKEREQQAEKEINQRTEQEKMDSEKAKMKIDEKKDTFSKFSETQGGNVLNLF